MSYIRNREIKYFIAIILTITTPLVILGFIVNTFTGTMVLITALSLCISFLLFTGYRYLQIKKLSLYLRRISLGDYTLDVRDNAEGELSILKNDIYKVTLMLSEYNEQLKKEKLLLSNHMSDISHQLKTPLTSMMVMVDLLRNEELPQEKRREFMTIITHQMERIEWLVSSLLKMSKLDAGVITMALEPVAADQLIYDAIKPFLITMELKEITYQVEASSHMLQCDKSWTTEAITNIIKNCIEHTPKGGTIRIGHKDNPLYTELKISDTGTGISKEDLPYIFTRFYRGKNASSDSVGIGLALAYQIMKNQQGDITVTSKEDIGTTFILRLYKSVV